MLSKEEQNRLTELYLDFLDADPSVEHYDEYLKYVSSAVSRFATDPMNFRYLCEFITDMNEYNTFETCIRFNDINKTKIDLFFPMFCHSAGRNKTNRKTPEEIFDHIFHVDVSLRAVEHTRVAFNLAADDIFTEEHMSRTLAYICAHR